MREHTLKLLYVSPERLSDERFRATLRPHKIALMAIDEAHCISEWGHNFRPEYMKLALAAKDLGVVRVLALTATAPPSVAADIARAFDIDSAGKAANRRIFLQFGEGDGFPDGMTVDSQGCLWIALWDGWCVRRYSPGGDWLETFRMPVARPTSCAFGGLELDQLYITSASIGLDETALRMQPNAGGLFMMEPGVRGLKDVPFAG